MMTPEWNVGLLRESLKALPDDWPLDIVNFEVWCNKPTAKVTVVLHVPAEMAEAVTRMGAIEASKKLVKGKHDGIYLTDK